MGVTQFVPFKFFHRFIVLIPWQHPIMVYIRCMSRTNVNIDDTACAEVMRRYHLKTKREAVNFALRALAVEPFGVEEARRLRGSGWEGDLGELRTGRSK